MEIRPLTAADAQAFRAIRLEALERHPFAYGRDAAEYRQTTPEDEATRIAGLPPQSFLLGCFDHGVLVATAAFNRTQGRKELHKGHINSVYVAASHRGQGIGRTLLTALVEKASADPTLEQILLSVSTRQHVAHHLYTQLGFILCGTEPNAVKIGDDYSDEDMMVLRLRQPLR